MIEILKEWNPWWEKKELINELKGKSRFLYKNLIDSVDIKEITIIIGVRRSGKSTLMYQIIDNLLNKIDPEQVLFVNLEDKKLKKLSLEEIYNYYKENLNPRKKAFIFLDEIHKKEGWESWIRKKYDLKTNDKFIISGSCSYLLKKEYSTLLTGRNLTFEVFPLSFKEYLLFEDISIKKIVLDRTKHKIINYLRKYISLGGFPGIFFSPERYKINILEQYFDDILYKDIIDRFNLNSQKAKDLALFLIFNLEHFSYSFKEQKTLASKIYCIDNGLRNAVSFKFSKDEGKLVENMVFIELMRRDKDVYYWKCKGEVDFIVKNNDQSLTAINVSYTDEIDEREIRGLLEFKKGFNKTKDLILITKDLEKKEKGINFIPLWRWLL